MNTIGIDPDEASTDKDGFLLDQDDWSPAWAEKTAAQHGIHLLDTHWEIIHEVQDFYQLYQRSPSMRPLVKFIRQQLGAEKGTSIYLLRLFPQSPAMHCARIGGLPRPENCL